MFLTNNFSLTDLKLYKYILQIDQIKYMKNIYYISYIMTSELFLKMKLMNSFYRKSVSFYLHPSLSIPSKKYPWHFWKHNKVSDDSINITIKILKYKYIYLLCDRLEDTFYRFCMKYRHLSCLCYEKTQKCRLLERMKTKQICLKI